jgi:hypothetical protein
MAPSVRAKEAVAPLLTLGWPVDEIAAFLRYQPAYVREVAAALGRPRPARADYAPWTPPDSEADERRRALDRGAALAAAKVAAGAWVLPRAVRP